LWRESLAYTPTRHFWKGDIVGRRNSNRDHLGRFARDRQREKEVHARRRAAKARDRYRDIGHDYVHHVSTREVSARHEKRPHFVDDL